MTTLGLSYLNYAEQKRSNLAKEAETHRANIENEARNRSALLEEIRAHQADEDLKLKDIQEKERSARETANIRREELGETITSHRNTEELKSQEVGLKDADLQALIKYRDATLGLERDKLVNNAWNSFADRLQKLNIPWASLISIGAAVSGLKSVEDKSIVDTAIGDIISEVGSLISPQDSEERESILTTLSNIDSQVREFAYKTLGSVTYMLDHASEFMADFSSASQFGTAVSKVFKSMADSARDLSGGTGALSDKVAAKFNQWGKDISQWFTDVYQKGVQFGNKVGMSAAEWISENAAKLKPDLSKLFK